MIPFSVSTISDLRYKTKQVLDKAGKGPVTILNRTTPKGVLLSMEEYTNITSALEDYYLSIRAQEYEQEDKSKVNWIPQKDLEKNFRP